MYREHTKIIKIGNKRIGGGNPILMQSMTNTKTEDVEATAAQILKLEAAGCDIIRCAVPTMQAAEALGEIKKRIHIPLVADIHFDYRLAIAGYFRPGHADYTFDQKYGFRDYRGGGRSSGRETVGRVAAGAVACEVLKSLGVTVTAYTKEIGGISVDMAKTDIGDIFKSPLYMPDLEASEKAELLLEQKMKEQDSVGGVIECVVKGLPAGVGEPVFDKLDARLAKAVMSIGAVKGFEIGDGFAAAKSFGSDNNDSFIIRQDGSVAKETNHAGGILGGISDGSDIILRAAVKPTPSIARTQRTVNRSGEEIEVNIRGRHDPIIVPRAVVVVESMAALVIVDMLFSSMASNMDAVRRFFGR